MRKIRFRQPLQCNICKTKGFQYWEFNGQEFVPDGFDQCPCGENPAFEIVGDIQQYAGLKDKEGVEICEGDIYTWFQPLAGAGKQIYKTHAEVVRWNIPELFFLKNRLEGPYGIDVIGNTHQNPELLKI